MEKSTLEYEAGVMATKDPKQAALKKKAAALRLKLKRAADAAELVRIHHKEAAAAAEMILKHHDEALAEAAAIEDEMDAEPPLFVSVVAEPVTPVAPAKKSWWDRFWNGDD
jgi:hypothetical protein